MIAERLAVPADLSGDRRGVLEAAPPPGTSPEAKEAVPPDRHLFSVMMGLVRDAQYGVPESRCEESG